MLRRFNYTNRKRINRDDVSVVLRRTQEDIQFDADLSLLTTYEFQRDCRVFVEAYRQTIWSRFDFGVLGALESPSDRSLARFGTPDGIHFRVKIADPLSHHRLVAEADGIPLRAADDSTLPAESLLRIIQAPLQTEIFRVSYDEDGPVLEINKSAGEKAAIAKDPAFSSLVYPIVFKDILVRILLVEEYNDLENIEAWQTQWLLFATGLAGVVAPPQTGDVDELDEWITSAVTAFAGTTNAASKFAKHWEGQE